MAYKNHEGLTEGTNNQSEGSDAIHLTLHEDGSSIDLPDASYVRDAEIIRDGMDLVLDSPNGEVIIDGYFAAESAPDLVAPDGSTLYPELVNSFAKSPAVYAENSTMTDVSPVGSVHEITGEATVTRIDGSIEKVGLHTPIFQGDVIETAADGAVNIMFIDETSFAVSEDARLAIDEYVFDPSSESGVQNFSVLKGVFVFTSGLIGRDDPDDVEIDTPMGSIGIRGTIIAGDVDSGEITVVEGAIVLRDFNGNEVTLANQFETAQFDLVGRGIEHKGELSADDVAQRFSSVSKVSPSLFSSINDAAEEQAQDATIDETKEELQEPKEEAVKEDAARGEEQDANPDGSVDQNSDQDVDGSLKESKVEDGTVDEAGEEGKGGEEIANQNPQNVDGAEVVAEEAPVEAAPKPLQNLVKTLVAQTLNGNELDGTKLANALNPELAEKVIVKVNEIVEQIETDREIEPAIDDVQQIDVTVDQAPPDVIDPPFDVQITRFAFNEINAGPYTAGTVVATVAGVNGDIGSVSLLGGFSHLFNVVQNGNNYDIVIASGVQANEIDFDLLSYQGRLDGGGDDFLIGLNIQSTDGEGLTRFVRPDVQNVDEGGPQNNQVVPDEYLAVSETDALWVHHVGGDFHGGADFGPLTFAISNVQYSVSGGGFTPVSGFNDLDGSAGATGPHIIDGVTLNSGVILFNFIPGEDLASDYQIRFDITATDEHGNNVTGQYTLDMFNNTIATNGFSSGLNDQDGAVYTNTTATSLFTLTDTDSANIFLGDNADNVLLTNTNSAGDTAFNVINLGNGLNTITVDIDAVGGNNIENNVVIGGAHEDTFIIRSGNAAADNRFFGGYGDDVFELHLDQILSGVTASMNNIGSDVDGGFNHSEALFVLDQQGIAPRALWPYVETGQGDTLKIVDTSGSMISIDFAGINNINNIEKLDFADSTNTGIISLAFDDIVSMTDGHNTLMITKDTGDTLILAEDPGDQEFNGIQHHGNVNVDGQNYDVYTSSHGGETVTLLVDDTTNIQVNGGALSSV